MTGQTRRAIGRGARVGGVAVAAARVARLGVQRRQGPRRVAALARGRFGRTARTVRTVAALAAALHCRVRAGAALSTMTAGAALGAGTAVRLVAGRAAPVAGRGAPVHVGVTARATLADRSVVRSMALAAATVASGQLRVLLAVTGVAGGEAGLGSVREPAVAAVAVAVTLLTRRCSDLTVVAPAAQPARTSLEREIMRAVAVGARERAGVKGMLPCSALVTAAACARPCFAGAAGMRVVAHRARAMAADLRVVRLQLVVTALASGIAGPYVVRAVTAGASIVLARAEHRLALVAGRALDPLRLAGLVRSVAADALGVPLGEQGRRRHRGFVFGVARRAGLPRVLGGLVQMLMTGRARLGHAASLLGVPGLDVVVAAGARRRHDGRLVVRPMTAAAVALRVHDHRGQVALRALVAAQTAPSGVRSAVLLLAESVAAAAVRRSVRSEARPRLLEGVGDAGFFLVTLGTTRRRRAADLVAREIVTLGARDLLAADVDLVAGHEPRSMPCSLHGDSRTALVVGAGRAERERRRQHQPTTAWMRRAPHGAPL